MKVGSRSKGVECIKLVEMRSVSGEADLLESMDEVSRALEPWSRGSLIFAHGCMVANPHERPLKPASAVIRGGWPPCKSQGKSTKDTARKGLCFAFS